MSPQSLLLSAHAETVLEKRFLLRDDTGVLVEDAPALFRRVARAIAGIDDRYGDFRAAASEEAFLDAMTSLRFLPNSPTLMNAGVARGQLAGCFVLPLADSMDSIYATLRDAALVQKSGGGTGFSFSALRPKGAYIRSTRGASSGPVSFMRLFDYSTQVNRLGGTRAGANMGVLRHDHPDILEFVNAKRDPESLSSFNISVLAGDAFMHAVDRGESIALTFPGLSAEAPRVIDAQALFGHIVRNAWETGDPGMLFGDRINAANPTPALGRIEATNPCGEQPLLPNESCTLGSINVARFVRGGRIDYAALGDTIPIAVHFLDNVLDANDYPVEAIRAATLGTRKVGLGIMGFADLLVALGVPYASREAEAIACELMAFVQETAAAASARLAATRGPFPHFAASRFAAGGAPARRHACVTTIAPTGTISLLADCSSGIEPYFALSYRREVIGATAAVDVHPQVDAAVRIGAANSDTHAVFRTIRATGRLPLDAPPALRALLATAHEIAPEWHVKMQAAFQRFTDTSVSKTINLANDAAPDAIARAYRLAFETGCKGVTVFRDGCKNRQVLRAGVQPDRCAECGEPLVMQSGCQTCASCGYSVCSV